MYNTLPVGVSEDGYYTYKAGIDSPYVSGEFQIASGIVCKAVAQMGDYLVVAVKKSDGVYLYYASGTLGSLTFTSQKILSSTEAEPLGLAYAVGLYMMPYTEGGVLKLWAAGTLAAFGTVLNAGLAKLSSYTYGGITTDGGAVGITGYNGTTARVVKIS